jgi:hypothetical protein
MKPAAVLGANDGGSSWTPRLDNLSCGLGLFGVRSLALGDFRLQGTISGAPRDLLFAKPMESGGIATRF